jgi:hypothetical protein
MGRPKTSEPRSAQFNVSLTRSELEHVKRRAQAVGMRPVHFGRALLLDPARNIATNREPVTNVQRPLCAELARLGNLLNQMVRHLHRTGDPLPADLEPLLNDVRRLLARWRSE